MRGKSREDSRQLSALSFQPKQLTAEIAKIAEKNLPRFAFSALSACLAVEDFADG
jgi:hypothetical protein